MLTLDGGESALHGWNDDRVHISLDTSFAERSSLLFGGIYVDGYAYSTYSNPNCHNPGGRKGGLGHRRTVGYLDRAAREFHVNDEKYTFENEYRIITSEGLKKSRYADFALVPPEGSNEPVYLFQVGVRNKSESPVAREVRAINDIWNAKEKCIIYFIPYK